MVLFDNVQAPIKIHNRGICWID